MEGGLPAWPAPLRAGGVVLRAFGPEDVGAVRDLATDPYVPLTGSLPAHADEAQAAAWIERQCGRLAAGLGYSFAIADAEDGTALGQVGLWLADLPAGRLTVGYAVAPRARGRGAATDALRALLPFAATVPGVRRVEAHVEPWNEASLRTAERAGFVRDGVLLRHAEVGGVRRDVVRLVHRPDLRSGSASGSPAERR